MYVMYCHVTERAVLCCAVLCCAVLCCAVLRCAALRCAVLCCAVLCCAVLCCAVLCYDVMCCAALCCAGVGVGTVAGHQGLLLGNPRIQRLSPWKEVRTPSPRAPSVWGINSTPNCVRCCGDLFPTPSVALEWS